MNSLYLSKSEDELKAWVESIDDSQARKAINIWKALNDIWYQKQWAEQFSETYNEVSPETKLELHEATLAIKAQYKTKMLAAKALMFLALQEVLLQKETK